MKREKCETGIVSVYVLLQIFLLFCLRKFFLLTVFQTVAAYAAVCMIGFLTLYVTQRQGTKRKDLWNAVRDAYLILWSGFHGVIVLGFLTCGTYYLTLTQMTVVQLVNVFLGMAVYWFFYVLTKKAVTAVGWGNLFIGILGTLNYYLVRFRGAPFQLSDIKAAGTAGNVLGSYDFSPTPLLIIALADLILWYIVWRIYFRKEHPRRWNVCKMIGSVVICCGIIALPVMGFGGIYAETSQFAQDTCLSALFAEIMGSNESLPEEYSADAVREIAEKFKAEEENGNVLTGERKPHIIVIMNEAFSDLRVLGELETTEEFLPFWDSIESNCIRGWANVSVLGGTTANSEYEFLSSDAVSLFPGEIPYNKYFTVHSAYPGLVSVLTAQGYESTAFHPYLSSGWNRTQVYRAMGFDRILFKENLEENPETLRIYASDAWDYDYIKKYFETGKTDKPQFFFNITMQNHGGYTYEGDDFETTVQLAGETAGRFPQTEQYLSLIQASDAALKDLFSYFEAYDEPVVLVVFGDHQPRLEDGFYEYITGQPMSLWDIDRRRKLYKTPFIIWHNYETESADIGDVSLNYLASIVLEDIGLTMSDYQRYVLQQYEKMPVVNAVAIEDAAGNVFPKGSREYAEESAAYKLMIYNHTADIEGRLEGFYEISEGE